MGPQSTHSPPAANWSIDRKVTKELKPFDGSSLHYKSWRDRVMDHLTRCNVHWAELLNFVESEHAVLNWSRLAAATPFFTVATKGYTCDLVTVAQTLWSFIGEHMTTALFDRRTAMSSGEERNGIEL